MLVVVVQQQVVLQGVRRSEECSLQVAHHLTMLGALSARHRPPSTHLAGHRLDSRVLIREVELAALGTAGHQGSHTGAPRLAIGRGEVC